MAAVPSNIRIRCKYSEKGIRVLRPQKNPKYGINHEIRLGYIIAIRFDEVTVLWDGRVTVERFHESLIAKVSEPKKIFNAGTAERPLIFEYGTCGLPIPPNYIKSSIEN